MRKHSFNIGDIVEVVESNLTGFYGHTKDVGLIGEITSTAGVDYEIKFQYEFPWTHDCNGKYKTHQYRYYLPDAIKLVTIAETDVIEEISTDEIAILLGN